MNAHFNASKRTDPTMITNNETKDQKTKTFQVAGIPNAQTKKAVNTPPEIPLLINALIIANLVPRFRRRPVDAQVVSLRDLRSEE